MVMQLNCDELIHSTHSNRLEIVRNHHESFVFTLNRCIYIIKLSRCSWKCIDANRNKKWEHISQSKNNIYSLFCCLFVFNRSFFCFFFFFNCSQIQKRKWESMPNIQKIIVQVYDFDTFFWLFDCTTCFIVFTIGIPSNVLLNAFPMLFRNAWNPYSAIWRTHFLCSQFQIFVE